MKDFAFILCIIIGMFAAFGVLYILLFKIMDFGYWYLDFLTRKFGFVFGSVIWWGTPILGISFVVWSALT